MSLQCLLCDRLERRKWFAHYNWSKATVWLIKNTFLSQNPAGSSRLKLKGKLSCSLHGGSDILCVPPSLWPRASFMGPLVEMRQEEVTSQFPVWGNVAAQANEGTEQAVHARPMWQSGCYLLIVDNCDGGYMTQQGFNHRWLRLRVQFNDSSITE